MPELPEVETIRRDLEDSLQGQVIKKIKILGETSVKGSHRSFVKQLQGRRIASVERRAKLLIFNFDDEDLHMMLHLKMTGQLVHVSGQKILSGAFALSQLENGLAFEQQENSAGRHKAHELPNTWTRVYFELDDGSTLFFNDIRRFGYLKLHNNQEKQKILGRYGIEPLTENFSLENFQKIFKGRKTWLKSLLLNQELVAGLGNIYVDEICFYAGVRPGRRVPRVTQKEIKKLHKGCEVIIAAALKNRGTSFSDYRDAKGKKGSNQNALKVYGRADKPCFTCGQKITKIKLVGRGTSFCRNCQS